MNSKAIRKQLLAAVAMVLVAAVALGSSTYAWFVASGTVTATGMKVKAQSDGNLVIRYKNGGVWGTSATADVTTAKELKPISTPDLDTWVSANAEDPMYSKANLATAGIVDLGYNDDEDDTDRTAACYDNDYALVKYFQIASASLENAPMGLKLEKIIVNGTDDAPISFEKNMSTALRIGVKVTYKATVDSQVKDVTKSYIFAPVTKTANTPTDNYAYIKQHTDNKFYYSTNEAIFGSGADADVVKLNDYANTEIVPQTVKITQSTDPVKVYVYVWFEGEDANLRSSNFAAEDLDVTLKFTSIAKSST